MTHDRFAPLRSGRWSAHVPLRAAAHPQGAMTHHRFSPFRSGRWSAPDPPNAAKHVEGVPVVERLAIRADPPGALVRLQNGRLAILGEIYAIGRPSYLVRWAAQHARRAATRGDGAWWEHVRRLLAGETPASLATIASAPAGTRSQA